MDTERCKAIINLIKSEVDLNYEEILKVYLSEEFALFLQENIEESLELESELGLRVEVNSYIKRDYQVVYRSDSPLIGVKSEIKFKFLKDVMKRDPNKYLNALNESICPHCSEKRQLTFAHQNCSYVEEYKNYYLACDECHYEIHQRFEEMWEDVRSYG